MKNRKKITIAALIMLFTALICLAVLLLWQFGILPWDQTEESLFVKGYLFLPLPLIGFVTAILVQAFSVRGAKKNKR
ncbi:MAG: hypothetical protein II049_05920 [Clostridia bacterium]|nr:hypothetical protein [Clostridia bacterium]